MSFDPRSLGARCNACPRRFQKPVPSDGNPVTAQVVWLGQDPGAREVEEGKPFVGPTGTRTWNIWTKACQDNGVPVLPRASIYIMNAAACMPLSKRESEAKAAMTCCRPRALRELKAVIDAEGAADAFGPLMILAMGKWALFALTGKPTGMGKLQGFHVEIDLDAAILDAERNAMLAEERAATLRAKEPEEEDIPF
jgi:uracil-DNA glycosylase family 4